jgi:tetratricopeptide (TPR) repeat protein
MQLESQLVRLEGSDLVRRLSEPEVSYFFKHALVQDTASASLLHQERKRLHRLVGEALETVYAEGVEDFFVLLAQHFEFAGEDAKTFKYAMQAGEAALRTNARAEALEHFTRALHAAERANLDTTDAFLKRGRVLENQDRYPEALENYKAMERTAEEKHQPALKLAALLARATLHSIPSVMFDSVLAATLTARALELAQELGDKPAEAKLLWNQLLAYSRADVRYTEAVESGERGLAIARAENLPELTAYLLNDLSPILGFLGQAERAEEYNLESRAMWRTFNNLPMMSDNFGYAVMNYLFRAEYRAAIQASQEGLQISREISNLWGEAFAQTWVGQVYWEVGEIATAIRVMENALVLAERSFAAPLVITRTDLARLYCEFGDTEHALGLAQAALERAVTQFPSMLARAQGALALVYLRRGDLEAAWELVCDVSMELGENTPPLYEWERVRVRIELMLLRKELAEARATCERVLEHLRAHHIDLYYVVFQILYARVLEAQREAVDAQDNAAASEEEEHALEVLELARETCIAQQAQWSLWQVSALLAKHHARPGNSDEASRAREEARSIIESIAARTPESLRAGFLKLAASRL